MSGTRWRTTLRRCMGEVNRELRITLTPVPKPGKWVFLVGCYNSGTTLISEVLANHDMIGGLPTEGHFLTDQFPSEHELGISRMWTYREDLYRLTERDEGPDVIRIKKEWGMRMNHSKPVFLEKSPQNSARTRWLQKHFDNAYFIAIIRNGYAVAEGISRKARPKARMERWPTCVSAEQWCRSNQILEEDAAYLDRIHWVRYEDFTDNPDCELTKILKFLELDLCGNIDLGKQWAIHERSQSIRNLNDESIARLSKDEVRSINEVAGDCMSHFGYTLLPE